MSPRDYTPQREPLSDAQRVAAVRHLAAGYNLDVVATILHTSRDHVVDGLHNAADELVRRRDQAGAPRLHPNAADIARVTRAVAAAPARLEVDEPPTRPRITSPADRFRAARQIAAEASLDPSYRVRQAGAKLADALVRLESTRKREQRAQRDREQRAAAREQAKASSRLTKHPGAFPCRVDGCDDVRDTAQGRTLHELRAHGRPHASQETTP